MKWWENGRGEGGSGRGIVAITQVVAMGTVPEARGTGS